MRNASAKSGVLVSLGDTDDEILQAMRNATDMRAHNIDMLMIGSWGNLPKTLQLTKPRMRHAALLCRQHLPGRVSLQNGRLFPAQKQPIPPRQFLIAISLMHSDQLFQQIPVHGFHALRQHLGPAINLR